MLNRKGGLVLKNVDFIRERITQLRMQKNVSEYQMSMELGQNKGYIQGITSGRSLPSMTMFFEICDYFEITPEEFFATAQGNTHTVQSIMEKVRALTPSTLELLEQWLNLVQ
ncbi:helix-turn-helix transcriptional regulator [Ruthenibacterium sp. CLA-JM-H11]|uniref:Helix-turn-helix transcriptional regulator n=1 Tax=Ruthenibacterium intestinale TaxID=3133163 RepID=A0ABV1GE65_9FIRM